jgi:hypothetical protein
MPDKAPQFLGGTLQDGIPDQEHLLVVPESQIGNLRHELQGRQYEPLFSYPAQALVVYEVMASQQGNRSR